MQLYNLFLISDRRAQKKQNPRTIGLELKIPCVDALYPAAAGKFPKVTQGHKVVQKLFAI